MEIICENLQKSFGELAVLRGVSLKITPGEPICVTGESGSGKTTLLRIIMGLEKPDAGEVKLVPGGEKPRFGAVFQEDRLFEDLNAVKNIRLACSVRDDGAIKTELLRLLPEDAIEKPVRQLSGGQRRRVAIVRALLLQSDAVVMDEPFAGLDEENKCRAQEYIRERTKSVPTIIAAHAADVPPWCRVITITS